jgi:hypothetical protein
MMQREKGFSLELLINAIVQGILMGGFYAAISLGLSISFGILDIVNIAHPVFWIDSKGNNPPPFTVITDIDVENGVWRPFNPKWQARALAYVKTLKVNGRYMLMIWPPHCLIGTWGHSIVPCVADALYQWEKDTFNRVNFVAKGSNLFT